MASEGHARAHARAHTNTHSILSAAVLPYLCSRDPERLPGVCRPQKPQQCLNNHPQVYLGKATDDAESVEMFSWFLLSMEENR